MCPKSHSKTAAKLPGSPNLSQKGGFSVSELDRMAIFNGHRQGRLRVNLPRGHLAIFLFLNFLPHSAVCFLALQSFVSWATCFQNRNPTQLRHSILPPSTDLTEAEFCRRGLWQGGRTEYF